MASRDLDSMPPVSGDMQCKAACEAGEAPIDCANGDECQSGEVCCNYSMLATNMFFQTIVVQERAQCSTTCLGGAPLCETDAHCEASDTCTAVSFISGYRACGSN